MEQGENKRKHLQLIQDVITRMASNSFLLRGWSITLVTAVIGFTLKAQGEAYGVYLLLTATILVLVFWLLDAYYLSQERAYKGLYKEVCGKSESNIDFSLNATGHIKGYNTWISSMFSSVFLVFYLPAFFILVLVSSNLIGITIYIK